ncbi:para-aminobenzoate synthase component I [Escherichia coli]|nr:para-aminobenzoate synthase component I [Escherichia coli]
MLLHSGYADHPYSRFDIVVADPICTLTTFGKETVVSESEKRTTTTDDPLQVLQQVLDRADIRPTHNEDLPFQGGALGLFGYDLGRRFESLPEIAEQDIVLPDMAVGIYDWALIVDHQRHTVSLLSHNDVNARRAWLESQQFSPQEDFTLTSDWQIQYDPRAVRRKISPVQEYLHSGDCYQVKSRPAFSCDLFWR